MLFPQPDSKTVNELMEPTDEACPNCSEHTVFRYRVVDYRGWLRVTKCRSCLTVTSSERMLAPAQGG